jgi:DNA polymerase elongation subunit (family B)
MFRNSIIKNDINPDNEDIVFQIVDWYATDVEKRLDDDDDEDAEDEAAKDTEYAIKAFGVDSIGRSVGLTITGYEPHFYIEVVGVNLSYIDNYERVRRHLLEKFAKKLSIAHIPEHKDRDMKVNMYGFTNNTKKCFMKIVFSNLKGFKSAIYNLKQVSFGRSETYKAIQYESNIEPFIRFIHAAGIEPCGWIKIPKDKYNFNDSILRASTNIDIITDWENVKKYSSCKLAPLVVASFDIECTSSHGDFPMAIKSYKKTGRELFEYYKTLKAKFAPELEIQEFLLKEIHSLFNIDDLPHGVLTYVIPKKNHVIDKQLIKTESINLIGDIIKIMKDTPNTDKKISDFFKFNLKIEHAPELIKALKAKHEMLNRFNKDNETIEDEIMNMMYNDFKGTDKDQKSIYIKTCMNNSGIIMALFDNDTIFDKLAQQFDKMGCPKLDGDSIIQVGTTFHIYGQKECFYKHIITLKDCDANFDVNEIIECSSEKQVLTEWKKLIMEMDPDIITGYNTFGFDNGYLRDRSIELKCAKSFEKLGRLRDIVYDSKRLQTQAFITKELQSSALGQNILKYYAMEGRVQIDLMKTIQKDHKLDTYKLDAVASTFITGKIKKVFDNKTVIIDNIIGLTENNFIKMCDTKFQVSGIDEETNTISINNEDDVDISEAKVWGMVKDDITPNEIFEAQNKGPKERALIAKYCVQDCALCNYLMMKLEIIANNIGMANVCLVPLSYIFLRGQGIKIFSLVAEQCLQDGFIIPVIRKADDIEDSYEGAIVLEPEIGIYEDPVSVLDFASLYPSSMISENISHDSIVLNKKYDNLPDTEYIDIKYDVNGQETTVRFAQFKNGEKGILPRILMKLLSQRKLTRKKMLYKTVETLNGDVMSGLMTDDTEGAVTLKDLATDETFVIEKSHVKQTYDTYNEFEQAVLDGMQLAYKVTANSLYGQVGAKTSSIYLQELAASTTATGRNLVMKLKDFAEENYDCKVVYGDSVLPNTPIIIKYKNEIFIKPIEKLTELTQTSWNEYSRFLKEGTDKEKSDLEMENIETWTHQGWKQIKKVIRHKCKKKIYRVLTHTGMVDVTEDHSLLNADLEEVKPSDVSIGTELFHRSPDILIDQVNNNYWSYERQFVVGMFIGDGSCGYYECKSGDKHSWAINNSDYSLLEKCKGYLETLYHMHTFNIYDTMKSSGVYKLSVNGNVKSFVIEWRSLCYEGLSKIIPKNVYFKESLLDGLWASDGCRKDYETNGCKRIDTKNQVSAQSYYLYLTSLGYNVSLNTRCDKDNIFRLTFSKNKFRKNPHAIKKIDVLHESYDDYVYDIETEAGTFQAGIGNMIVKNTDSIFIKFTSLPDENGFELSGKDRLQASIDKSIELSKKFKPQLRKPHDAEYEKTFWPFIIMSKKRYVGNLYEEDVNKFKQKSMGIVLKRRDNANILKTVYGGMIDIILNENNVDKSIDFLKTKLKNIENGNIPIHDLVITKTLRGSYADPSKIAHKVLADRMVDRDPGSAPQINERVPYVFIHNKNKKALQGDRIEHPDFIKKNNVKIDYAFYITNQIMKPVSQLLSLRVEQIKGYKKPSNYFIDLKEKYQKEYKGDSTRVKDKINDTKEAEVNKLIFEPILVNLKKKANGQTSIGDFF